MKQIHYSMTLIHVNQFSINITMVFFPLYTQILIGGHRNNTYNNDDDNNNNDVTVLYRLQ